jgi:phosphopantetheinyl transferase
MRLFYSEFTGSGHEAAYRLLAWAFFREYGYKMPEIAKTEYSKPYFPFLDNVHFSISHTKNMVMVALASNPCGCDIELIRPHRPGLESYVCTQRELECLDFFSLWTLKESYIKLKGRLVSPLKSLEFSLQDGKICSPEIGIFCHTYNLGSCRAAACCEGEQVDSECIFVSQSELESFLY